MHFMSPIFRRGGEISNKLLSWHSYASNDMKKYSYITCRREQSPAKFDTYPRQVKSTFGWEADLNTLTARQVKSTFSTKRLMIWYIVRCNWVGSRTIMILYIVWCNLVDSTVMIYIVSCDWVHNNTSMIRYIHNCNWFDSSTVMI